MGESRRVALLARPGEACERLRAALREAGGDIVLEADPSSLDPQSLRAAAVQTVLVALDPAVEDALEKFDDVLSDRAVEVIFDEADLAARREGWDAARWVRHLAAKLHRHDDVLPPGREPDAAAFAGQNEVPMEELPEVEAIELDVAALDAVDLDALAFDVEVEAASEPEPEPGIVLESLPDAAEHIDVVEEAPVAFGGLSLTDDLDALEFDGGDITLASDAPAPTFGGDVQDFDALMRDLGTPGAGDEDVIEMPPVREFAPTEELPGLGFDIAPLDAPTKQEAELAMPDFGSLSLEAVSDAPAGMTLRSTDAPLAPKFKHDLSDLERRISSLELVDPGTPEPKPAPAPTSAAPALDIPALDPLPTPDAIPGFDVVPTVEATPTPTAPANTGAVLILAGIGGPDAVRQILTALPDGFARPVLISQRLDGGRYDRLVQQMARAAALPVHLAEADTAVAPGHVYIVPPDLGIDATGGLRFSPGASQLDALPAGDTAVLLLSGADPALVEPALAHAANGALVAGQSPEGCYDATAPTALVARGGTAGTPHELVQSLLQRWPA